MPEQFALQQGGGQCGTADADKGFSGPVAVQVQLLSKKFLTDAAFANDKHRRLCLCHPADNIHQVQDDRTFCDERMIILSHVHCILQHIDSVLVALEHGRIVICAARKVSKHRKNGKVFFIKRLVARLVYQLDNADAFLLHPHGEGYHVTGYVIGFVLDIGKKAGIMHDIIQDERLIVSSNPTGYAVTANLDVLRIRAFRSKRYHKTQGSIFFIKQKNGSRLAFHKTHCRLQN